MKTIVELKKSATVLDRKALKNLLGGYVECEEGQLPYLCTVSVTGGSSWSGYACAVGPLTALTNVYETLIHQGWKRGDFIVNC